MTDFSYLNQIEVKEQTAQYRIGEIEVNGVSPTLTVRPTTQSNERYFNAVLKDATKQAKKTAGSGVNAAALSESRDRDRNLFARFVVTEWENVLDGAGNPVPFSPDACEKFLAALPDWKFDDIRVFCGRSQNFLNAAVINVGEEEETAGN